MAAAAAGSQFATATSALIRIRVLILFVSYASVATLWRQPANNQSTNTANNISWRWRWRDADLLICRFLLDEVVAAAALLVLCIFLESTWVHFSVAIAYAGQCSTAIQTLTPRRLRRRSWAELIIIIIFLSFFFFWHLFAQLHRNVPLKMPSEFVCASAFCAGNLPTVGQASPSLLEHCCRWPTTTTATAGTAGTAGTTRASNPPPPIPVVQPPNFWRETTILQSRLTSFKLFLNKSKPPAVRLSRSVF